LAKKSKFNIGKLPSSGNGKRYVTSTGVNTYDRYLSAGRLVSRDSSATAREWTIRVGPINARENGAAGTVGIS